MKKMTERERDTIRHVDGAFQTLIKHPTKHIIPASVGRSHNPPAFESDVNTKTYIHLYYTKSGSGLLCLDDHRYSIGAGDFFVVPSGTDPRLLSSPDERWDYRWMGFTGALSYDFLGFPTVFHLPEEISKRLYVYDLEQPVQNLASRLTSDLYLIHSVMQPPEESKADYVQIVIDRIRTSYMEKLTVADLAEECNLNRSHLSRLFKEKMKVSIQDYLLQYRLAEAKRYLKHNYSVSETAQLCGFYDHANFYKVFTREIGYSPKEWKKMIEQRTQNTPK